MASTSYSGSPCAACKFLRRKCLPDCIFAPYFPPEEPQKFANVHKIFGASNVSKLLHDISPEQREDAVNSLAYEAEARIKDPVYGCVGAISILQRQVLRLQKELETTNADLIRYSTSAAATDTNSTSAFGAGGFLSHQMAAVAGCRQRYFDGNGMSLNYGSSHYQWNDNASDGHDSGGEGAI